MISFNKKLEFAKKDEFINLTSEGLFNHDTVSRITESEFSCHHLKFAPFYGMMRLQIGFQWLPA
jgi:hypothetical protein